ncbi:hypothetical protein Brsp06_03490 [Brucella sp. NBRC 13694]|uniref:hypothetical protein n=1 Tax=Brucella sp. NBRC 13694 TaxID=3075482 RepID=UPI0030B31450
MFYNALDGAVAVRDEIELVVDPALVPDDADWEFGAVSGGHFATKRKDYIEIEHYRSMLGSVDLQAYRDAIDTLMGDYTVMFPYWLGFKRTKSVKNWDAYMQWLAVALVYDDPTSASFATFQYVSYGTTKHTLDMVVYMFGSPTAAQAFLNTHGGKDYRFDPKYGMSAWRNWLASQGQPVP